MTQQDYQQQLDMIQEISKRYFSNLKAADRAERRLRNMCLTALGVFAISLGYLGAAAYDIYTNSSENSRQRISIENAPGLSLDRKLEYTGGGSLE